MIYFNMRFEELENTIKAVLGNDEIVKDGLVMVYQLDTDKHRKLEEHIFFKNNPSAKKKDFEPRDDFELDIEDFTILVVKKEDEADVKSVTKKKIIKKPPKKVWYSGLKSLFWGDEKDN